MVIIKCVILLLLTTVNTAAANTRPRPTPNKKSNISINTFTDMRGLAVFIGTRGRYMTSRRINKNRQPPIDIIYFIDGLTRQKKQLEQRLRTRPALYCETQSLSSTFFWCV